jgi:plastocyanin
MSLLRNILAIATAVLAVQSAQAQTTYREITVTNGGSISGTVKLLNAPTTPATFNLKSTIAHCGKSKPISCFTIGKNGGLANAVVYLEGVTQGKKMPANRNVTLDQKDCVYTPHTVIVPVGGSIELVNSDPVLHNVHAYALHRPPSGTTTSVPPTEFNIPLPIKGFKIARQMKEPGVFLTLCDAGHPWMSAHIVVAAHPYYAVTDADGKYNLTDIPAGKYKLRLWHEGNTAVEKEKANFLAAKPFTQEKDVTVTAKGTVDASFGL